MSCVDNFSVDTAESSPANQEHVLAQAPSAFLPRCATHGKGYMQPIRLKTLGVVLLPLLLTACGGGGSTTPVPAAANSNTPSTTPDSGTSTNPTDGGNTDNSGAESPDVVTGNNTSSEGETTDTGGNNSNSVDSTDTSGETPEPAAALGGTTIDGRVADGYLQGATICVDVNENGSCDEDEPQTISAAGGVYSLDIPEDAAGKPIVADIPAEAIDEDTGEPIGKKLVFSTPGDKPSFVSPITTLVHQELKNNPSLNSADAEATVMETLGLPDDEETSLFTDYVAESDSNDESKRDKFRFIHQTARVVASMLDEIRENVETSAVNNGIDLAGDSEARKAVHKLVREEVRALLPEISAAVADRIVEIREANEFSAAEVNLTDAFDPTEVANGVEREESSADIAEQIDAIKNEKPVTQASMKDLLTAGIYMLDVDCEHDDDYGQEDGLEEPSVDSVAVMLSDDGSPELAEIPENCFANYTHVLLDDESNLNLQHYYFDQEMAVWKAETEDEFSDKEPHQFVLKDGEWIPSSGDGPEGAVEFTDDGGAILSTGEGKLLVYATTRSLDDTPILNHLLNRGGDRSIGKLVTSSELFPSESNVHKLHIKRSQQQYVLLNWYSHDDDSGEDFCAQYDDNCNVIDVMDDNGFIPVQTLTEIQEGSLDNIVINEIAHDIRDNRPIDLQFRADPKIEGALPASGIVKWVVPKFTDEFNPTPNPFDELDPTPEPYDPVPYDACYPATDDTTLTVAEQGLEDTREFAEICEPPEYLAPEDCVGINNEEVVFEPSFIPVDVDDNGEPIELQLDEQTENIEFEEIPASLTVTDSPDGLPPVPPCLQLNPDIEKLLSDDVTGETQRENKEHNLGESRWRLITVDNIEMIEIDIPVSVRHRIDLDDVASMLLIDDEQYVRRGARFSDQSIDDEISYSESAFGTLQPIIEKYVSQ